MLESCKYLKFQEVNFKILARILLTPKILAAVKFDPSLSACPWCTGLGTLEHMLLLCKTVTSAWKFLVLRNKNIMLPWKEHYRIFGTKKNSLNLIVWVTNFVIYKTYLWILNSHHDDLDAVIQSECARYSKLFPILGSLK